MHLDNVATGEAYQFGDSDLAAERLRRLAEVFNPSTREFLLPLAAGRPQIVADLGCGPGYTTRLLAEVFPSARVLGIDSSPNFVALARQTPSDRVEYEVADVTQTLPGGPYDLVYCRYLLTHLPRPTAAIELWSNCLQPGGVIAIEENQWIQTEEPAFAKYLAIVEAMLADSGQRLYVGAELDQVNCWPLLQKQSSELVPIETNARDAARMFELNLPSWRGRPFIQRTYPAAELDDLHAQLERLAADDSDRRSITFGRRRLVLAHIVR